MRIAVCDDNINDRIALEYHIKYIMKERKFEGSVQSFQSGEKLLTAISHDNFSVYFLDIYMSGVSGIQAAYEIRQKSPDACIIFTTSSPDHMAEGFDVGAVHYILKPVTKEAVEQAIDRVQRLTYEYERYITLQIGRISNNLLLSEIIAVESKDKNCLITTTKEVHKVYIRMDELEDILSDDRYLRCHRSYLINMDYAMGVVDGNFKLINGMIIPIKRDRRLEFKQQFHDYCFEKLRKEMKT
ncbi:MAG: LytR/AlgR family response regulator transcription factor [Lachnospiraceae bacterium]